MRPRFPPGSRLLHPQLGGQRGLHGALDAAALGRARQTHGPRIIQACDTRKGVGGGGASRMAGRIVVGGEEKREARAFGALDAVHYHLCLTAQTR